MDGWPLFDAYLRGPEQLLAPTTISAYRIKLTRLEEHVGYPFTHDTEWLLTAPHVRSFFRDHPGLSHWTHNQTLSASKKWHRFGVIEGWWPKNGIAELSLPSPPDDPLPPLTPHQVAELLRAMRTPREIRLVMLGIFAGTRITEACRMDAPCWLPDRLRFRGSKKPYKFREVPIHPELERYRERILSEQGLRDQSLKHVHRCLRDRVGFDWIPHGLRRTFSQALLDAKVVPEVVESLMGHAHKSMTLRKYGRVPFEVKAEAVPLVPFRVRSILADQLTLF